MNNDNADALKPGDEGYVDPNAGNDGNDDAGNDNQDGNEGDGDNGDNNGNKKPEETPEAKRARLTRQLAQLDKKYPVQNQDDKKPSKKSDDLDYGEKAFLISNGIKGEEMDIVKDFMRNTGKSLDDAVSNKYLQAELKEFRDTQAAAAATPAGSKRSGQSAQSTVEYWIAKGELPPASERELRQKVVNARIKSSTNTNVFTDNPVVK